MIIEGQVHGGLTEGYAIAMGQEIAYDDMGNVTTASLMDFFLPTAVENPGLGDRLDRDPITTSPDRRKKGLAKSPNVGSVPCFSNAVNDAFAHLGVTHLQMPHDAWRVWTECKRLGLTG